MMTSKLSSSVLALSTTALLMSCGQKPKEQAKNNTKPNVVFIYADDIGFGDLSCNGAKTISTPNVEKLANSGVRFTNVHSGAATSTPSRYAMLTGEYAWRKEGTGIAAGDAGMIIRPQIYTLADMFKDANYHTAAIGKWHLGLGEKTGTQDWNGHITPGLSDIGFDYSYIMAATADRVPCVFVENGSVVNLDPNDPISVSYTDSFPGVPTAKNNPHLLKLHPTQGHDQAIINGIPRIGYMKGGNAALWQDENIADSITTKAIQFIEQNQNEPFFLYLATNDAHVPRLPHPRFAGKSGMGSRGDAILEFDWTVGQIMETLKRLGLDENTIVVLSSDNGPVVDDGYADQAIELLGDHKPAGPYRGGKYASYEGGTRVPCIVSWKGTIEPKVSNALLCQIDWIKSFAAAVGVTVPEGAAPDSENQWDSWTGKNEKGREYLVLQNQDNNLSITDGSWKYIEPANGPAYNIHTGTEVGNSKDPQLFDLTNDEGETTNCALIAKEKAGQLHTKLQEIKDNRVGLKQN